MDLLIKIGVGLIAFLHLYFLWFEMFAWETRGKKIFRQFPEHLFTPTKALAANQGLYNGFLAAGLLWTYFIESLEWQEYIALFFLSCIAIAGIYGALTASKKIFYVQGLPALITIILILTNQTTA